MIKEPLLKERIEKYYADQDPRIIWQLSSDDFKRRTTEREYTEYFEEHNYLKKMKDVVFSIEEMNIAGNEARVKMRIQAGAMDSNTKINEVLYDYWIFERGNWYMRDPGRTEYK